MKTKRLSSRKIYEWQSNRVIEDVVTLDGVKRFKYTYIKHPGSVVIVPKINEDEVLMLKQYRYPIKKYSLEYPAGGVKRGEKPPDAAIRELKEEVKLSAVKIKKIGEFFPSNSLCSERAYVFIAERMIRTSKVKKENKFENILGVELISFKKVLNLIRAGKIQDGFSIIATYLAKDYFISD